MDKALFLASVASATPAVRVELAGGGHVFVRSMSVAARDAFERNCAAAEDRKDISGIRALAIACTACDENGSLIFDPSVADEMRIIAGMGAESAERIFEAALAVSGIGAADRKALALGNSPGDPRA